MNPHLATLVYITVIAGLFYLTRERKLHLSPALIIPFVLIWVSGSRSIAEWVAMLQTGEAPSVDRATSYAEGSPLDRNILICLMVLSIIILIRRGRIQSLIKANLPIVIFLLFAGASVFWSDFPEITIRRWFRAVGCVLMVAIALTESEKDVAVRRVIAWVGFFLIPLSVLFIKYYPDLGRIYIKESINNWLLSPVGVTSHKNILGAISQVFGIVFTWELLNALFDREKKYRLRRCIAYGIAISMIAWLFVQADSMTAQSSFLLAVILLLAVRLPFVARTPWIVHTLVICLLLMPVAVLFMGVGSGAIESMGRNSTLTGRTEIWPRVIALVPNALLGAGFDSFWLGDRLEAMDAYQQSLNEAHNGFVETYANLGWIGVLLIAVLIITGYRNIARTLRRDPAGASFRFAIFITVMVSSLTEAALRTTSLTWVTFLLVTLAMPERRSKLRNLSPQREQALAADAESSVVLAGAKRNAAMIRDRSSALRTRWYRKA